MEGVKLRKAREEKEKRINMKDDNAMIFPPLYFQQVLSFSLSQLCSENFKPCFVFCLIPEPLSAPGMASPPRNIQLLLWPSHFGIPFSTRLGPPRASNFCTSKPCPWATYLPHILPSQEYELTEGRDLDLSFFLLVSVYSN